MSDTLDTPAGFRPGSILGTAVRRVEDPELITGRGTYVANLATPDTTHAVLVRSPFAHALITGIDTTEAQQAPGVVAVLTGADVEGIAAPSFASANPSLTRPLLSADRVRFVGEPVAVVVAETRAQAVDAAELVDVDYDPLPVAADLTSALADDAPLQFPDHGTNVARGQRDGDDSDPLAGATHVVRLTMTNQRIATNPIEGHAVLADPTAEPFTIQLSTQHPHGARDMSARLLGLEKDQVRLVAPHVGGGFGGKAAMAAEHGIIVLAAQRTGRPVLWWETRSEALLSMHGRDQVHWAELGLDADGRIFGLRLRVAGNTGAYAGFGGGLALGPTYLMATGPYRIPQLRYDGIAVLTNTVPNGAFRGAGRPEAAALLERLLDLAATQIGIAPEEIRRRNLLTPEEFPYRTPTGADYDNGDYQRALDEVIRLADLEALRAEQRRRRDAGEVRQLGLGLSTYVEVTGFGGTEFGAVHVHDDGSATVRAGTSAHGQGHATSFSMIVADRLGIPLDKITYEQSDTATVRSGGGTGGSRSLQMGGSAVKAAADEAYDRGLALAAELLEANADDLTLGDDGFAVSGVPGAHVSWADLAARALEHGEPLEVDLDIQLEGATFPFGAHLSVVEVDTETGFVTPVRHVAVDDAGRILNPMIVAGQQHGGAIQGLSQALWEGFVYDDQGNPLTSTLGDYTMPTAADVIQLEATTIETPTPRNPLGAKGIGESATVGATPAVHNAVVDALSHLGVRHLDMPLTPHTVWTAIQQARVGTLPDPWREPPAVFADQPPRQSRVPRDEAPEI
ncbi:xanthine dehydrogenase family protein molybdopterin-binding subunit [Nocardioides sp.]|uniref:xanthine dehydrogenase family protein molybdopterin-binding subunit n=1 Tax=Nocardioides sp. TaxID=35761 RepID=UPI00352964EC